MEEPTKLDINLKDVDFNALQFVIDVLEREAVQNDNKSRGMPLFQRVRELVGMLRQEMSRARNEKYEEQYPGDGKDGYDDPIDRLFQGLHKFQSKTDKTKW